jgi:hypothetical protein
MAFDWKKTFSAAAAGVVAFVGTAFGADLDLPTKKGPPPAPVVSTPQSIHYVYPFDQVGIRVLANFGAANIGFQDYNQNKYQIGYSGNVPIPVQGCHTGCPPYWNYNFGDSTLINNSSYNVGGVLLRDTTAGVSSGVLQVGANFLGLRTDYWNAPNIGKGVVAFGIDTGIDFAAQALAEFVQKGVAPSKTFNFCQNTYWDANDVPTTTYCNSTTVNNRFDFKAVGERVLAAKARVGVEWTVDTMNNASYQATRKFTGLASVFNAFDNN